MRQHLQATTKIAVIGTINRDTVVRADGSRHEGYGGILYNLKTLSALCPPNTSILPVVRIGRDHAATILRQLERGRHLDLSAARIVDRANNHCFLRYHDDASKSEVLKGWVGGVSHDQLRLITGAGFILVNFISGADISQNNLHWLRRTSNRLIYMDFHSRSLGRRADGRRFIRRPRDWRECLACANFLQMNELEFRLLSGKEANGASCRNFITNSLPRTCRCLIVTRGSAGCFVTFRAGKGFGFEAIAAPANGTVVDTTGCGDIFSAGFLAAYAQSGNLVRAARFATLLASWRTQFGDFFELDLASISLKEKQ